MLPQLCDVLGLLWSLWIEQLRSAAVLLHRGGVVQQLRGFVWQASAAL